MPDEWDFKNSANIQKEHANLEPLDQDNSHIDVAKSKSISFLLPFLIDSFGILDVRIPIELISLHISQRPNDMNSCSWQY